MIQNASEWAKKTWGEVDLGDKRLNERTVAMGVKMAANPEGSLPQQLQQPIELQAAYRFLNNRHVNLQALLEPHYKQTREAAGCQKIVLWVNDLTEIDYTFHNAKRGLGPIGNGKGKGFLLHSTIGIVPGSREVLGLGAVQTLLRQPAPKPRPKWTRTAEGLAWENAVAQVGQAPEGMVWIHVSDAGSDYFAYMAACVDQNKHFLVRVSRNRLLTWGEDEPEASQIEARKLVDYVRSLPLEADSAYSIQVAEHKQHPARQAEVVMAWTKVTLSPSPQAPADEQAHSPIAAWGLRVWEPNPPAQVEAIEWILLSSLPITSLIEAKTTVEHYTCRWFCEDFHQCLKTGCKIERSQLNNRTDLERLIGFAAPIAVRLLQFRQFARQTPEVLAVNMVEPLIVEVLARQLKTDYQVMTIYTFWRLVAQLGGFQGRKRDGHPGWRTIWRGWQYLSNLTDGVRLFVDVRT